MSKRLKIDVVILTIGEWCLPLCIKRVRKYISVNKLILVGPKSLGQDVQSLADIFVPFDERNIGKKRAKGLRYVKTEYYASIDSDVLINPQWYSWCVKTIQAEDVGACQGYARSIARISGQIEEARERRSCLFGRGIVGLGSTLLKTRVVKQVGMPEFSVNEDWHLRLRMEQAGYRWVWNINLVSIHLKTDVDVWKQHISRGKMGKLRPVFTYGFTQSVPGYLSKLYFLDRVIAMAPALRELSQICYYLTIGLLRHPLNENLFEVACRLSLIYGRLLRSLDEAKKHLLQQ